MSDRPFLSFGLRIGRKVRAPWNGITPNGSALPLKTAMTESATETIKGETPPLSGGVPWRQGDSVNPIRCKAGWKKKNSLVFPGLFLPAA